MTAPSFLSYLLQGAALGFSAAITPGAFQTYMIAESLSGGWRRGAPVAFAPLFSDFPIILLSLLLLNQLSESFLQVIGIAGGVFALYLAWRMWSVWRQGTDLPREDSSTDRGSLRRGVLANILNPGPYLFWSLVSGPILLAALRESYLFGAAFLLGFYFMMVMSSIAIVLIFSQARRLGPRIVHALLLISTVILVIFAGVLLTRGIFG